MRDDNTLRINYGRLQTIYTKLQDKEGLPDSLEVLNQANKLAGENLPGLGLGTRKSLADRQERTFQREQLRDAYIAIENGIINAQGEVIR
jgi:hypothetical protein